MAKGKKEKILHDFLAKAQIFILDKSNMGRSSLARSLRELGALTSNIDLFSRAEEAKAKLQEKKPALLISDYQVVGGNGFDFFRDFRQMFPEDKESLLILSTSNNSQSLVAQAAEEDVDSYIIKPFTVDRLGEILADSVYRKLYPSEYILTVEKGKELLFADKASEAIAHFDKALELNPKPTLAHFYRAQAEMLLNKQDLAQDDLESGLEINHIHFKCLVGLFELFMKRDEPFQAYDVVKKLARYFPANPHRLQQVIRLAVMTTNFQDMPQYYDLFLDLEQREAMTKRYICAGLYVSSKYFFTQGDFGLAVKLAQCMAVTSDENPRFLLSAIELLSNYAFFDDAEKVLKRFPPGERSSPEFLIGEYLSSLGSLSPERRVQNGMELINQDIQNACVYRCVLDGLKKLGKQLRLAETLADAIRLWPDLNWEKWKTTKTPKTPEAA